MGRSQTLGYQRNVPNGQPSGSKRPSAYDRFPSGARNMWLNELQAKIEGAFNPPASPGPSRSPSPLEEDTHPLGVAQDEELAVAGPSSQGLSVSGEEEEEEEGDEDDEGEDESIEGEEQEEADYDEEEDYEDYEPDVPGGAGYPPSQQLAQEQLYEDDEVEEGDYEEDEEEDELEDQEPQSASALDRPRLEEEDLFSAGMLDPRLAEGGQWEENQSGFAAGQDDVELEEHTNSPQPLFYPHDTEGEEEDDVMYVGDTDEDDEFEEDEEDVEEDELDDDGMGGEDFEGASAGQEPSPARELEQEQQIDVERSNDAVAVGVEDGQTIYGPPTTLAPEDIFVNLASGFSANLASGFSDNLLGDPSQPQLITFDAPSMTDPMYPSLPFFGLSSTPANAPTVAESSSSAIYPPLSSLPQVQFDNDLIDPSLLADFAQRVEAQASGSLGGTTEAQNTSEMTALADAVVNTYQDDDEGLRAAQNTEEVNSFQHGMGENEQDGYEEDHESQSERDLEVGEHVQADDQDDASLASGETEDSEASEDESDSEEEEEEAASSPRTGVANTRDEPIEILSSDDEEEEEEEVENEEEEEQELDLEGDAEAVTPAGSADSQSTLPDQESLHGTSRIGAHLQAENEDEEEEEVEPERPTSTHIRFESYHPDMLTPPKSYRASSQSSSRAPYDSASVPASSPSAARQTHPIAQSGNMEVEEEEEEVEVDEADLTIAEDARDSAADTQPQAQDANDGLATTPSEQEGVPTVLVDETIEETIIVESTEMDEGMDVDKQYDIEIEEPVTPGPSMPLVTPAVEIPLDAVFPIPAEAEANIEAIMRAIVGEPDVVEEADEEGLDIQTPAVEEDPEAIDLVDLERAADTAEQSALASAYLSPNPDVAQAGTGPGLMVVDDDVDFPDAPATPEATPIEPVAEVVSAQDAPALPDPYAAPDNTDNIMPDVPFHRSRTPSLVVEPPPNPPYPEIVVERVVDATPSPSPSPPPTDLPRPEDPVPDTSIEVAEALSPHHIKPTLERSPSLLVNVEEVDLMLDPGPNDDREETPVEFPDPAQPAPLTDVEPPFEPQDLSPRLEARSASMEAIAPVGADAPIVSDLVEMVVSREDSPVLFPEPGEAAPNTDMLSPLDVHQDLPMVIDSGSDIAPSLIVEPPSEPATGPPSLRGSISEAAEPDHLTLPGQHMAIDQNPEGSASTLPTSSDIDAPSAFDTADDAIAESETEAGPSSATAESSRLASPLRHHHGSGRHTSVPPPAAARATRSHARRSSAAPEALHPPVTRQNCHYRKLYLVEGDMSAVVLVPQCTLADHALLEEEHAEDRGEPTRSEEAEARHQPISESHLRLHLALTARLHRIVGSGIFDEEGKTYLLQANDAALLPDAEDTSSTPADKAPVSSSSKSPLRPRRSKRLSEAPSETSIKEDSTTASRRGVSVGRTASPVVEENIDMSENHNVRSDAENISESGDQDTEIQEDGSDTETEGNSEIVVEQNRDLAEEDRSETASPTATTREELGASSTRYSLRSKGDAADVSTEVEETNTTPARATRSKARTVTPSAEPTSANATAQAVTPMTTRRRARESVAFETSPEETASPSGRSKGKGKARADDVDTAVTDDIDEDDTGKVVTPAKPKSSGRKGKSRQDDAKYKPLEDGDTSDSSSYLIPHEDGTSATGTGTGKKKRKIRLSISSQGNESPWQLDQPGSSESVSPSASRSSRNKRRAVASKDEPDVPVPEDAEKKEEEEEEEEAKAAEPARGWRRMFWPFSR